MSQQTEGLDAAVEPAGIDAEGGGVRSERRVDPGFRRNMLILGAVVAAGLLLVFVAVMRFSSSKGPASTAGVGVNADMAVQLDDTAKLSPQMQEALRESERRRVEQEEKAGGRVSVPSVVSGDVVAVDKGRTPDAMYDEVAARAQDSAMRQSQSQAQPQPMQRSASQQPQQAQQPEASPQSQDPYLAQQQQAQQSAELQAARQAQDESHRARIDLAKQQLAVGALLDVAVPQRVGFTRVDSASGAASPATTSAGAPSPVSSALLTDAMEIYAAELMSPIDSYKGNYVSARVISGKLQGAFVRGQISPSEDGVTMEFSQMRHAKQTCRISAVGMDEKTAHTMVDTDVDRRYLERYFWPVVVAAVGGAAQAKAATGQQIVPISNGGVAISTPPPTKEQVIAAGAQSAAQIIQREVDRAAARPPQFTLPVGSVIGLMFNEAVSADCAASR